MFGNRRHFRVLQERSEEGIASNILADRLRRLVSAGLLTRANVGRGHRATYSLTEAAIELVPLLALELTRSWANRLTAEDRRGLAPLFWSNINPYGTFHLDMTTRLDLDRADEEAATP